MTSLRLLPIAVAGLLVCSAATAQANTFTYTAAGFGTATFTTSAGELDVTITNLIENPASAADLLVGMEFKISPNTAMTLTSDTGTLRTIGANPVGPAGAPYVDSAPNQNLDWELGTSNGNPLLTGIGSGGPDETLVGPPNSGGDHLYDAANSSIAGNGPHNPFTAIVGTFVLTGAGITADSLIFDVIFYFNTDFSISHGGDCVSCGGGDIPGVPEPATLLLLGSGLLGAAAARNRRRKA